MQVVHVGSEVFPFSRSGGLGDVLGALPAEQAALGMQQEPGGQQAGEALEITVVSPWYDTLAGTPTEVWRGPLPELPPHELPGEVAGAEVRVGEIVQGGVRYLFIGLSVFERPGLYHPDDVWRFCLFGRTVLPALRQIGVVPDILHGHDWQAGLVVAHAHLAGVRTVFSIHNLQYQGKWNIAEGARWTGLPEWAFGPETLEFHGDLNLMKAGLVFADQVTTVSPTYAREITTPQYGEGLEGLLIRLTLDGRLSGIINGLDQERWNPRTDPDIQTFSNLDGKARATADLRAEFGLDASPILAAVSRLADQKGMDLLVEALPELIQGWNVVVLGGGDPLLEAALTGWAQHPRVTFVSGMNEGLAHRIYAGADAFAMPSRFEPCGLSQMIALRYGTLPVVRETGGLVDTVPHDVGFRFPEATPQGLSTACREARAEYDRRAAWRQRVDEAMGLDFGWAGPAGQYLELYLALSGRRR